MIVQRKLDGAKFYASLDGIHVVINGMKYSDREFARQFRIVSI
jgi:hypothetical protein